MSNKRKREEDTKKTKKKQKPSIPTPFIQDRSQPSKIIKKFNSEEIINDMKEIPFYETKWFKKSGLDFSNNTDKTAIQRFSSFIVYLNSKNKNFNEETLKDMSLYDDYFQEVIKEGILNIRNLKDWKTAFNKIVKANFDDIDLTGVDGWSSMEDRIKDKLSSEKSQSGNDDDEEEVENEKEEDDPFAMIQSHEDLCTVRWAWENMKEEKDELVEKMIYLTNKMENIPLEVIDTFVFDGLDHDKENKVITIKNKDGDIVARIGENSSKKEDVWRYSLYRLYALYLSNWNNDKKKQYMRGGLLLKFVKSERGFKDGFYKTGERYRTFEVKRIEEEVKQYEKTGKRGKTFESPGFYKVKKTKKKVVELDYDSSDEEEIPNFQQLYIQQMYMQQMKMMQMMSMGMMSPMGMGITPMGVTPMDFAKMNCIMSPKDMKSPMKSYKSPKSKKSPMNSMMSRKDERRKGTDVIKKKIVKKTEQTSYDIDPMKEITTTQVSSQKELVENVCYINCEFIGCVFDKDTCIEEGQEGRVEIEKVVQGQNIVNKYLKNCKICK